MLFRFSPINNIYQSLPVHTRRDHWTCSQPACPPVSRSDAQQRHSRAPVSWFYSRTGTEQNEGKYKVNQIKLILYTIKKKLWIIKPHPITGKRLWHCVKHGMIILHRHVTERLTHDRLLKLPPDLLTVVPAYERCAFIQSCYTTCGLSQTGKGL